MRRTLTTLRKLFVLTLALCAPLKSHAYDINGDGKDDILWQNTATGQVIYWTMSVLSKTSSAVLANPGSAWRLVDTADVDYDGKADLIWQKDTGELAYWKMNGATHVSGAYITPSAPVGLRLIAAVDLNGDGKPDLLFQNPANGQVSYRLLNGVTQTTIGNIGSAPGANWKLIGAADLDHDGNVDLIWQDTTAGQNDRVAYWLLNGLTVKATGYITGNFAGYRAMGVLDIDGDGQPDIIGQSKTDGNPQYFIIRSLKVAFIGPYNLAREAGADISGIRSSVAPPIVTRLELLPDYSALYGIARVRVKNLVRPGAAVTVRVGSNFSPISTLAYIHQAAPADSAAWGGAIDFRIPYNLASGNQSLYVTINGKQPPAFAVKVSNPNPFAVFTLANGTKFVVELRQDKAPKTVANFVGLATGTIYWLDPFTYMVTSAPLYDGTKFHRCIGGFIRQGGDPLTKQPESPFQPYGTGGPGYTIPFEVTGLLHEDGAISMARGYDLNSIGSQFFICDGAQPTLNPTFNTQNQPTGGYVVFGKVAQGLANVKAIPLTEDSLGNPIQGMVPMTLTSVVITGKLDGP